MQKGKCLHAIFIFRFHTNFSLFFSEIRVGASLICKSATAYNPFIYYFMSEGFRADLRWLGRRAGFSTKTTATGSTYQPSFRSSTRSRLRPLFCNAVAVMYLSEAATLTFRYVLVHFPFPFIRRRIE